MQETKHCPYCGEEIKSVAIKCKFCGEALDKQAVNTMQQTNNNQFNQNGQIPLGFIKDTNGNVIPKPSGFNFLAFLFGPAYFAGYKNINYPVIYLVVSILLLLGARDAITSNDLEMLTGAMGFMSIFGIIFQIVCGFTANSTLQVKQIEFNWSYAILFIFVFIIIYAVTLPIG